MSVDQRLRAGLSANTEHLQPDPERDLALLLGRARRRRQVRVAGVAVAVAAVAIAVPGVADSIRTSDVSTPSDRPTQSISPRPAPSNPLPTQSISPRPAPSDAPSNPLVMQPGKHSFRFYSVKPANAPRGLAGLRAVVEVPEGFLDLKRRLEPETTLGVQPPDEARGVEFATVDLVNATFCGINYRPTGPSVADLATVLADLPPYRSTDPVPTSLGGYDGLYLEISWPTDLRTCTRREENRGAGGLMGSAATGTDMALAGPGAAYRLWILDVDGERVMIALYHRLDDAEDEIAELVDIVESTTFTGVEPGTE